MCKNPISHFEFCHLCTLDFQAQQEQCSAQKAQVNQGSNVSVTNRMMAMNLVEEPSKGRITQQTGFSFRATSISK